MTTKNAIASTNPEIVDLDEVIRELDAGRNCLPEKALRTCQRHRELIAPRLIQVLEEAVRLGRDGEVREGEAPFFAVFLLTEFGVKESLPVILQLYALRDPVLGKLVGGAITETPRRVLATLAGDQPDLIESLISNQQLDDFIRWEAAASLCCLVGDNRLPRADAINRLVRQLRLAVDAEDYWGVTITVDKLGDLNPLEVQEEIKAAFDQGFVDESVLDWSFFEEYLLVADKPGSCPNLEKSRPTVIADSVDELSGWWCFSEEARAMYARVSEKNDREQTQQVSNRRPQLDFSEPEVVPIGTIRHESLRIGRNDPCPCGSGKKYKKCCLRSSDSI